MRCGRSARLSMRRCASCRRRSAAYSWDRRARRLIGEGFGIKFVGEAEDALVDHAPQHDVDKRGLVGPHKLLQDIPRHLEKSGDVMHKACVWACHYLETKAVSTREFLPQLLFSIPRIRNCGQA